MVVVFLLPSSSFSPMRLASTLTPGSIGEVDSSSDFARDKAERTGGKHTQGVYPRSSVQVPSIAFLLIDANLSALFSSEHTKFPSFDQLFEKI